MFRITKTVAAGALLSLFLAAGLATPAHAAAKGAKAAPVAVELPEGLDFGDDTSDWAKDDECDDPRFTGTGMAPETWEENERHDATDCRAAFIDGTITLIESSEPAVNTADIDFGDDSSRWSNDGECDDPRFAGTGIAAELEDVDIARDATDCRTLFEAGTIIFTGEAASTAVADIDYGDDTSDYAKDEECDDARFTGEGMASEFEWADIGHDATDCRAGVEAGTLSFVSEATGIDFGDDSSEWAKDGECDDPRFSGPGMADQPAEADRGHDATDCRTLFEAGLTFNGPTVATVDTPATAAATAEIDYGNDTSEWAKDDECDDPRFEGPAVAEGPLDENIGRDATDCRAAVEAGSASYIGEAGAPAVAVFDYGADWSQWANDGECDDPRFAGPGTSKKLLDEDEYGDATDCRTLVEAGEVRIIPVYEPSYAAAGPYDTKGVEFGDNTSSYANDELCDDPRFVGPGTASVLYEADAQHDAADCEAAYKAGTIMLVEDV